VVVDRKKWKAPAVRMCLWGSVELGIRSEKKRGGGLGNGGGKGEGRGRGLLDIQCFPVKVE